jgi:hypothetical protein
VYENFPSTVERVRLMLVNPAIMTTTEKNDFGWIADHVQLCVGVFVIHALSHGTYKLFSLGNNPSPDHKRFEFNTNEERSRYIFGGKFSGRKADQGPN